MYALFKVDNSFISTVFFQVFPHCMVYTMVAVLAVPVMTTGDGQIPLMDTNTALSVSPMVPASCVPPTL